MKPPAETDARFLREVNIEFLVHELKDPLAVIETGLRCLLEKQDRYGVLTGRQANTLQRSLRSTRKAWGILNDLLEVGRAEAACRCCSRFYPLPAVHAALKEALETMTGPEDEPLGTYHEPQALERLLQRHGIRLTAGAGVASAEMVQDEAQFRRMAGNLIKNALHHRRERVEIEVARDSDCLVLKVSDDGPGVDPAHRELIFRRYAQPSPSPVARRGHGLGLAGALVLARCLGGDIRVDCRPGNGASFTLVVPLQSPDANPRSENEEKE
jgi:two-component system, OmpR family, sensor kinase